MTIERYKNDAVTQLDGAIDGTQLTIDVIDAAALPTLTGGDQFRIRIDNEEDIIVSSVASNTLTVTRGTGATSHSDGSDVVHNLTAASLVNVVNDRDIQSFQLKIGKDWGLTAVVTPSQITSNQDNYAPTGIATANVLRLSTDASRNITGILAPSPEYARRLVIENIGSFNIVLKDDVTSTAANRFQLTGDLTLQPMQHVELMYDTTLDRWILLSGTGSITDHTHESSGAQGGTLDEDALVLADVTTDNVSITKHGFAPKAPNDATKYLDGTGAYSTPAGSSTAALILLEQHSASASATLDFTSFISSTYDDYEFHLLNIVPATSGALLWMRMGTGAGPTIDTGNNYSYEQLAWRAAASAVGGATAQSKIVLTISGLNTSANWGVVGRLYLYSPGAALFKQIEGSFHLLDNSGTPLRATNQIGGAYESATAVTAIQFLMSTGNITSGIIRAYGVAK